MRQALPLLLALFLVRPVLAEPALAWITVNSERTGFEQSETQRRFVPWGFNYDHDEAGRLLEDYWTDEWARVEQDFAEMRTLGANVVRIHLQVARFLEGPNQPNPPALVKLAQLLALAEREELYLNLTGLGCYHKPDVPEWYDELSEADRWKAQAVFWEAIAKTCAQSPAVFCYDLMNEPVSPAGGRAPRDWLGPPFGDKYFVQMISLSQGDRPRPEIARAWIGQLAAAIRRHDQRHLITVGLVDWSLDRPGLTSGFVPAQIAEDLDFLCVHLYPRSGAVDESLETLAAFAKVGKPVVVEETFPLSCTKEEFASFLDRSAPHAAGWIGFYWGKTRAEYAQGTTLVDALMGTWLDLFASRATGAPTSCLRRIASVKSRFAVVNERLVDDGTRCTLEIEAPTGIFQCELALTGHKFRALTLVILDQTEAEGVELAPAAEADERPEPLDLRNTPGVTIRLHEGNVVIEFDESAMQLLGAGGRFQFVNQYRN